jgi:hypothetical protein
MHDCATEARTQKNMCVRGVVGGWNAIGMTREMWKVEKADTPDLHASKKINLSK